MRPRILGRRRREPVKDYNRIEITDGDDINKAKIEMWVAKALGTRLMAIYPGREWSVRVDTEAEIVVIQCPNVSLDKGYVLSLNRSLNELTKMMASVGGEILERGGISRARIITEDDIATLPRDFRDEVISPDMLTPEERHIFKGNGVKH